MFLKMNWGFQELGVSELTPDRPALTFAFFTCEKSWFCEKKLIHSGYSFRLCIQAIHSGYSFRLSYRTHFLRHISARRGLSGAFLRQSLFKRSLQITFWQRIRNLRKISCRSAPELLILKTKTFPLCKNNENLEFRPQCKVLRFRNRIGSYRDRIGIV